MNKKGAELTLTMIVVVIILLIALVVSIIIFSGKFGVFSRTTASCEAQGGVCLERCPSTHAPLLGGKCDSGKCCMPIEKNEQT
ncbi:MAG: hypothetical protein QXG86_00325 [Candidatus Woesearchaeota archaeon]